MTNADNPNDGRRISQIGFGIAVLAVAMVVTMLILNVYLAAHQAWYTPTH